MADSTFTVYQRGIAAFDQFRACQGFTLAWPAPCSHVVSFISFLSLEGKAPATIRSYLSGVVFRHKINGWDDPSKVFIIQKLLEGSKRLHGHPDTRAPITLDILRSIVAILEKVCSSTYESTLFHAAFTLAFFAFLRVGEFTVRSRSDPGHKIIAINDIHFTGGASTSVQINLRFSKTNQLGLASTLTIGAGGSGELCPVSALKSFVSIRPQCSGPLFMHMDRTPLTRYQFQAILNKSLQVSGHTSLRYRSHSFRIGAATTAAMCGFDPDDIKRFGRWRSGAFQLYIRPELFGKV